MVQNLAGLLVNGWQLMTRKFNLVSRSSVRKTMATAYGFQTHPEQSLREKATQMEALLRQCGNAAYFVIVVIPVLISRLGYGGNSIPSEPEPRSRWPT